MSATIRSLSLFLLFSHSATFGLEETPKAAPVTKRRVWLDTDTSAGLPGKDVDDALALLHCIKSPSIELVGVSVVFGNAELEQQFDIAQAIVTRFGGTDSANLLVLRGAAGPEELGAPSPAAAGMLAALEASTADAPLTILAIGAATNVATLLRRHPTAVTATPGALAEVVLVAGRRPGQRFTTGEINPHGHPDLNFEKDAAAFRELLAAAPEAVPLTLCPFELSSKVWIMLADVEAARDGGTPVGAWVHKVGAPWLALWADVFGVDGFNPFDSLAAAYLEAPGLVGCDDGMAAWIEEGESDHADPRVQGNAGEIALAAGSGVGGGGGGRSSGGGSCDVDGTSRKGGEEGGNSGGGGASGGGGGIGEGRGRKLYLHVSAEGKPAGVDSPTRPVRYCHTPLPGVKEVVLRAIGVGQ